MLTRAAAPLSRGGTLPCCRVRMPSRSSSPMNMRNDEQHVPSCTCSLRQLAHRRARGPPGRAGRARGRPRGCRAARGRGGAPPPRNSERPSQARLGGPCRLRRRHAPHIHRRASPCQRWDRPRAGASPPPRRAAAPWSLHGRSWSSRLRRRPPHRGTVSSREAHRHQIPPSWEEGPSPIFVTNAYKSFCCRVPQDSGTGENVTFLEAKGRKHLLQNTENWFKEHVC
jgi:hypothetical protein